MPLFGHLSARLAGHHVELGQARPCRSVDPRFGKFCERLDPSPLGEDDLELVPLAKFRVRFTTANDHHSGAGLADRSTLLGQATDSCVSREDCPPLRRYERYPVHVFDVRGRNWTGGPVALVDADAAWVARVRDVCAQLNQELGDAEKISVDVVAELDFARHAGVLRLLPPLRLADVRTPAPQRHLRVPGCSPGRRARPRPQPRPGRVARSSRFL
jgi:hypothetical protein